MSENNYGALMLKSALDISVDVTKITSPGIYPIIHGNASVPDASSGLLKVSLTPSKPQITFQKENSSVVYSFVNGNWEKPTATDVDALAKSQNGSDIPDKPRFVQNIGLKETLNPTKRVSIGALGTGVFDGSKPAINIGDSDSGFVFESDGVIGVYANSQKIAELTNTEFKIIGNASLTNGALLLGGLTHFLRHTAADDAGFAGNNVEIGSWNGIGLTCTYDGTTRIYFNTRTGEIGLRGDLKADGNVRSGNAWLDQTGNLQGSSWGAGVSLKAYLDNTFNRKNTATLDTNGWHRDESTGLITQWGLIDQANGTYNFPRGFPNQCFAVLVTNTSAQGSGVDNAFGYPISNSQFFAGAKNNGGVVSAYPVAFTAFGR